jgi:hypothetical protein
MGIHGLGLLVLGRGFRAKLGSALRLLLGQVLLLLAPCLSAGYVGAWAW